MRAVVQRVRKAEVMVEGESIGSIGQGLMVFLGVGEGDEQDDLEYMVDKIVNLRIFSDEEGKMNRSLKDVDGHMLIVSQFTLYGDCRRGRRPSFSQAAEPRRAQDLYEEFVKRVEGEGVETATGEFQAMMDVEIHNQGPVTLLLDSRKTF